MFFANMSNDFYPKSGEMFTFVLLLLFANRISAYPVPDTEEEDMHPILTPRHGGPAEEAFHKFWHDNAIKVVKDRLERKRNKNIAKNVILFLGDGMSIATITATRVYSGGEHKQLSFDKFPYTALSKTYAVNMQVTDSASSATAYLTGVKGNYGTVGVTAKVKPKKCPDMADKSTHVKSIAHWSQLKGKSTGVVTVTRITHASPAGVYASAASRHWEADADLKKDHADPKICPDIATQLVFGDVGKNLNVIFGGGRGKFRMNDTKNIDEGERFDKDLIEEWKKSKPKGTAKYITKTSELLSIDTKLDYVMGLFHNDHMSFNMQRDPSKEPSLTEMTQAAIKLLSKNEKGFFLFVEGGNIDRAHHKATAHRALNETAEFSNAVQAAVDMTSEKDTLIVVTSDHSHTLSISGYSSRGHNIFGLDESGAIGKPSLDRLPYTTLSYANGPGYKPPGPNRTRYDFTNDDTTGNITYQFPGIAPTWSETHGGDDVGIFARGPWAHLYRGVMEENVIPHIMAFASCVGDQISACDEKKEEKKETTTEKSTSQKIAPVFYLILFQAVAFLILEQRF